MRNIFTVKYNGIQKPVEYKAIAEYHVKKSNSSKVILVKLLNIFPQFIIRY
jgi:hypothetical protein